MEEKPKKYQINFLGIATILGIIILTVVLLSVGARIFGSDKSGNLPASITVNGKGEIKATPNISTFSVTVSENAKTQSEALAKASEKTNTVIDALKKLGIAEKDIKTQYTSTDPQYQYNQGGAQPMMYPPVNGNQVIVGYTSNHTVSIKVRDLEMVPAVQKALADAKVQNISGPDLSIDDPEGLQLQARAIAINDAKAQAKILAEQLGVHLGNVVSFSDSNGGVYPMALSARSDMAVSKASPEANIATGEQTITSNVSVTYRIK